MGYSPRYPKTQNLINNINRDEIVKNFTNFACRAGAGPIKFWRSSNRFVFARSLRGVFDGVHRFLQLRKQLTGNDS
jgi:hypothetical protein